MCIFNMSQNASKNIASPIVLRSSSNVSAKSSKSSASTSSPLTVDDFSKTMDSFHKTQQDTLAQCKLLSKSQNAKFAELKECIGLLTTQVEELKKDNNALRNDVTDLNKRVLALEASSNSHTVSTANIVPTLLQEIIEREKCSKNIIIRGIPESSSTILADKISSDAVKIFEAIHPHFSDLPNGLKSIRLGKQRDNGPRPLKVFLPSKDFALKLITAFNARGRELPASSESRPISVVRDRTPLEREFIRSVYADLDSRRRNGEANIIIKYRDGLPTIVPISRLSQAPPSLSHVNQSKNY